MVNASPERPSASRRAAGFMSFNTAPVAVNIVGWVLPEGFLPPGPRMKLTTLARTTPQKTPNANDSSRLPGVRPPVPGLPAERPR